LALFSFLSEATIRIAPRNKRANKPVDDSCPVERLHSVVPATVQFDAPDERRMSV
jgi:hypothetical protein